MEPKAMFSTEETVHHFHPTCDRRFIRFIRGVSLSLYIYVYIYILCLIYIGFLLFVVSCPTKRPKVAALRVENSRQRSGDLGAGVTRNTLNTRGVGPGCNIMAITWL